MQPRLFLFYGTDSRASRAAVSAWEELFAKKYGDLTRYLIEADELTPAQVAQQLASYLEGQSLFETPRFILIKRVTSQDKAPSYAMSKAVIAAVQGSISSLDETVTVVLWETASLAATHPLLKQFSAWKEAGVANLRQFSIPTDRVVATVALDYVTNKGGSISEEAANWLRQEYASLGTKARLAKRLRAGDELLQDERGWWLYQVLDTALLAAGTKAISLEHVRLGQRDISAVGVFEIATAIANRRWRQARHLLNQLEAEGDDGIIFSLLAALRWQLGKTGSAKQAGDALRLLAEAELILKNFSPSPWWLLDVFINRMEDADSDSMIEPRRLWLAHLQRS